MSDPVRCIQYNDLPSGVRAGTFQRCGGVSHPPYNTLNLSATVGDAPSHVQANHRRIQSFFRGSLVTATQIHGNEVCCIEPGQSSPECDGLITAYPNIALGIYHADCQAALFFDPKTRVIAAIHAGWKGLVANIYQNTVSVLHKTYGTDPANLYVAFSPSLGPCHAEFIDYESLFPKSFCEYRIGEAHFNLWKIAQAQLIDAGIQQAHIQMPRACTYCMPEQWFSYRRANITGRNLSFIELVDA